MIAVGDQQTKRRFGDGNAEAEEGQGRLQGDGAGNLLGSDNDQRRQAVRQQMAEHDAAPGQREAHRGLDILPPALDHRGGADGARVVGPFDDHQREHDVHHALAEDGEDHQRHQDGREGELQVHQPHDDGVGAAAEEGREQAQRGADDRGEQGGSDADAEADAQAVEHAGEHVAALVVGAKPDRCSRRRMTEPGGRRPSMMSSCARSYGFCGVISGAKMAAAAIRTNTTRPAKREFGRREFSSEAVERGFLGREGCRDYGRLHGSFVIPVISRIG